MIPGSIDPECEAVTVQGGCLCGKQTEIEGDGYVGSQTPLPRSSLCHVTPLPHPEHTVSHMFYFLLLPQRMHPSPVCWLQVLLPPSWMSHWAPHSFVSHCLLPPARLSLALSQICSHVIHLTSLPFFLPRSWQCCFTLRCWAG